MPQLSSFYLEPPNTSSFLCRLYNKKSVLYQKKKKKVCIKAAFADYAI